MLSSVSRSARSVSSSAGEVTLVQPGQTQLVRSDVAAQDSQSIQVSLQTSRAGAAVDVHQRLNTKVEDVHGNLEHAHVGVNIDDVDLLVAAVVAADAIRECVRQAGQAALHVDHEHGLGHGCRSYPAKGVRGTR